MNYGFAESTPSPSSASSFYAQPSATPSFFETSYPSVSYQTYLDQMNVQETQPEIRTTEVSGKVVSDGINNGKFTIRNEKSQKEFHCLLNEKFFPIRKGDSILGIAQILVENGAPSLFFETKPLAKVGMDPLTIQRCFVEAQFNNGAKFRETDAKRLYDSILEIECSAEETLPRKIKKLDAMLNEAASINSNEGKNIGFLKNKPQIITETQSGKLLRWWHKNRNQRKLWLLSFTNTEIYDISRYCCLTFEEIYNQCMTDPYTLYPIELEKCEILVKYFGEKILTQESDVEYIKMYQGRVYTRVDNFCAKILRSIFNNSVKKGWMSTPLKFIRRDFPFYDTLQEHLLQNYPVVIEDENIYIKYFYDADKAVADYINTRNSLPLSGAFSLDGKNFEFLNPNISGEQKIAVETALTTPVSIITGGAGTGKCLHPETKVMLFSGESRKAKDLMVDDLLMGMDSKPRRITSLASGRDVMYKISTQWEDSFICNKAHILTLRLGEKIVDISVESYLNQIQQGNLLLKGYRLFRSYINTSSFSSNDFYEIQPLSALLNNFNLSTLGPDRVIILNRVCQTYFKHATSDTITLEFPSQDTYQGSRVKYLLHSMGLHCLYQKGQSTLLTFPGNYLDNTLHFLPIQDLDFTLEELGEGEYRGFTLNGDGRFLLSNFIVTHNTTIIKEIVRGLDQIGSEWRIVAPTGKSVARIKEEFKQEKEKFAPDTEEKILSKEDAIKMFRLKEHLDAEKDLDIIRAAAEGKLPTVVPGKEMRRTNVSTIHKLAYGLGFRINHLIVDECGMISTLIVYDFIRKFGTDFNLTLLGDKNQLSPIEAGNFFKELIHSKALKTTYLKKNFRSKINNIENGIVLNAEKMVENMNIPVGTIKPSFQFTLTQNFNFFNGDIDLISKLIVMFKQNGATANDLTIITPYNQYLDQMNKEMQQIFNGNNKQAVDNKGFVWKVGDRVAFKVNMYDIDLMNREEGIIVDIRNEDRVFIEKNETKKRKLSILRVRFRDGKEHDFLCNVTNYEVKEDEGKLEELAYNNMDQYDMLTSQLIRHSFAITVHSAQGSEWPHVVFFIPAREKKYQNSYRSNASQGDRFLTSNLVYTAITRATTSVIIVCPDSQIVVNAASQREAWRCDNLHAKIKRLTPEGEEVDPEMIEYSDQQALMNTMDDDDYFIFGDM